MANWTILKNAIANVIKTNGNQEITGRLLQNVLNNIVSSVGENATFAGVATPSTSPGVPDGPVFYIAYKVGTYSNFSGVSINSGGLHIIYNTSDKWLITDNLISSLKTDLQEADAILSERINAEAASRAEKDEELRNLVNVEATARIGADAELLKRIIGKSTASSAYNDPFRYLTDYQSEKDASGTITKHAIRVMQDALLDTLRHSDFHDSFPFIGHMRAHIEGVPIECWTYVKAWNTGSTNGVFVQVVRTNFGLKNGVISSALTESFHEYFRTVTVSMADGSVTDVTATAWQESTVTDALLNQIQDHEDRIWKLENQWYGIEWDTEVSSPAVTRIGNMDLHRTLPIQSRMRGCLLDDNGKVVKYLNPKDWTGEVRDGSRGQVMVEIPMHYRRCETEGTKRRVKMSEYPLPGFLPIPRMYVSAYEASLQRSTNKLCSVVNTDPDFRGGNNNAAWDGTYRSLLGRPATYINRPDFRTYARNRNNAATAEWNLYTYHVHKAIYWLYVVEYANRNSQLPFTAELTAEGFHQGGLGEGVSNFGNLQSFNNFYPFVPCGHTDSLGNSTGVVAYTVYNEDGSELETSYVPRYRGVENPFGHVWKITDGINVRISPTEENGGDNLSKVFVCEDPSNFSDKYYNSYMHVGNELRFEYYVRDIIFGEDGEIISYAAGGESTTYFCDYHSTGFPTIENLYIVMLGGAMYGSKSNGLASWNSASLPSNLIVEAGTRLCFLPSE